MARPVKMVASEREMRPVKMVSSERDMRPVKMVAYERDMRPVKVVAWKREMRPVKMAASEREMPMAVVGFHAVGQPKGEVIARSARQAGTRGDGAERRGGCQNRDRHEQAFHAGSPSSCAPLPGHDT
ncbi:MAG: hypothetical protein ACE5KF_08350 [Kiloniellaceae bacterium]